MRKMKVDGRLFQIVVTEQQLDGAQVRTRFEQMRGKTMPQRVRMNTLVETRAYGRLVAGVPDHLGSNRIGARMPTITGEEPGLGLQSAPVLAQGFQRTGLSMTSRSLRPLPPWMWTTIL